MKRLVDNLGESANVEERLSAMGSEAIGSTPDETARDFRVRVEPHAKAS